MKAVTEVDSLVTEVVPQGNPTEANDVLWCVLGCDRPLTIAVFLPVPDPCTEPVACFFALLERPSRVEAIGRWIAMDRKETL